MDFNTRLSIILEGQFEKEFKAAVAVVRKGRKWLLGLAKCEDDRNGKWVFPGGGMKSKESPEKAAVRECWEETGVRCRSVGSAFRYGNKKPHVAFVSCVASGKISLRPNEEFLALGFFTTQEMKHIDLYHNVKGIIRRIRS